MIVSKLINQIFIRFRRLFSDYIGLKILCSICLYKHSFTINFQIMKFNQNDQSYYDNY